MLSCSIWFSAPSFWMGGGRPMQRLSRPPPIQKLYIKLFLEKYSNTPNFTSVTYRHLGVEFVL